MKSDGLDPTSYPITKILIHSDVVRLLVPTSVLRREDLDHGILTCIEVRDTCTGNFLADFSNFERRTETTGWRFNALILFMKNTVVYRSWGGQPDVSEWEVDSNPLGPFQDLGPSLLSTH
jgi:hypothetical protein